LSIEIPRRILVEFHSLIRLLIIYKSMSALQRWVIHVGVTKDAHGVAGREKKGTDIPHSSCVIPIDVKSVS
jgi:hypothetical protein